MGERVTNNEAEYEAIIFSLKKLKLLLGKEKTKKMEVEFRSDSELLVRQMSGKYKIVEKTLQELFMKIWNLKTEFNRIDFTHIPRERNKEADRLANQALDENSKRSLF